MITIFTSTYVYSAAANTINLRTSDILYYANKEATDERRPFSALQYRFDSTGYVCPAMAMNYTAFEDGSSMVGSQHFPAEGSPAADDLASAMADFIAKGGKIAVVEEGKRAIDPLIKNCQCGCRGDWTDHTMRQGERGNYGGY